jgi:hypothetical protein
VTIGAGVLDCQAGSDDPLGEASLLVLTVFVPPPHPASALAATIKTTALLHTPALGPG